MSSEHDQSIERPCLYLVATPIGNLGDITQRALAVLRGVDFVCAEDTRTSMRLLDHYAIARPMESLHERNEGARTTAIIDRILRQREAVAVISDAGTPLISDPGYRLSRAAHASGIPVRSVPGASAALAGLTVSGMPVDRFTFEGFLPTRHAARIKRLSELSNATQTLIFFEAPHRINAALHD
ncbi:MAG: 16S rRNA (cytidine(1402)-2'-O)-methyltransferase, partial [Gammaproteobacteria bacterium]